MIAVAFAFYRFGVRAGSQSGGSSDLLYADVVSLPQLDSIASDQRIYYQGSNQWYHYIRVENVGFFRLRRSDVRIPKTGYDGDGAKSLGMIWMKLSIEDGKLKASEAANGIF